MKALKKLFKKRVKIAPIEMENTFYPALWIEDIQRKAYFTTYNVDLMNQIRMMHLNKLK